ncbi:galactose-binding domain-like protein [Tuber indicum]|nr:galactose-binding domain-like protein [Tuber indicum]
MRSLSPTTRIRLCLPALLTIYHIDESKAQEIFRSSCIDIISCDLGNQVLGFSDEWFATADNLINPAPPIRKPSVWETREHNRAPADWVIIKLRVPSGKVYGFEIDTACFNGNHAPAVTAEGTFLDRSHPGANTPWGEILTMQVGGPSQRHIWNLSSPAAKAYSHVRLNMFPDRFPVFPSDPYTIIDLAHVSSGGLAISHSCLNFAIKEANVLLPGGGKDAGNGLETNRSLEPGPVDWVAAKVIVDTLHFRGNYSQAVEIYTINSSDQHIASDVSGWELILAAHSCEADKGHAFQPTPFQDINGKMVVHVKMIIPDGGVKRLRVFGKRAIFAGN